MSDLSARQRLDTPRTSRRFALNVDVEAVGRLSESFARFLGTGRYLAIQTIFVLIWIALNLFAVRWQWDPYPFILLNLAFSTQAAYAAPLILLVQNRQEARDRAQAEDDRNAAERTQAATESLAREIAGVRGMPAGVVTGEELRNQVDELVTALARVTKSVQSPDLD